jgi:hypothetical protein
MVFVVVCHVIKCCSDRKMRTVNGKEYGPCRNVCTSCSTCTIYGSFVLMDICPLNLLLTTSSEDITTWYDQLNDTISDLMDKCHQSGLNLASMSIKSYMMWSNNIITLQLMYFKIYLIRWVWVNNQYNEL